MEKLNAKERYQRLADMFRLSQKISTQEILSRLNISRATLGRDLEYLRDKCDAHIVYDRTSETYVSDGQWQALPLWFSSQEAQAIFTLYAFLQHLELNSITETIKPLMNKIERLMRQNPKVLSKKDKSLATLIRQPADCIKLYNTHYRQKSTAYFSILADALLSGKRIECQYLARQHGEGQNALKRDALKRELSPQYLHYYRNNWYLYAYCHLRNAPRTFSLDLLTDVQSLEKAAYILPAADLNAIPRGYGIFQYQQVQLATLRFSPQRSVWIASEVWHPAQKGYFDVDGYYVLTLPYCDDTELCMEIMRYLPDVEVLEPTILRDKIRAKLIQASEKFL